MTTKNLKFKIGDIVKYSVEEFGDYASNPLWGGIQGKVKGVIIGFLGTQNLIKVKWENGTQNSYTPTSIELIDSQNHPLTTIFK